MRFLKNNLSALTITALVVAIFIVDLDLRLWQKPAQVIHDDVIAYYQYIPAVFIYKDLSLQNFVHIKDKGDVRIWVKQSALGRGIGKMTMGLSLMYVPFFLVAHALAQPLGNVPNGFSPIYAMALVMSSLFYLALGLIFLRKFLKTYFTEPVVAIVLLLLVLGTNILCYTILEPAMSHVYSFCLFAAFLLIMIRWFETPGWLQSCLLGLVGGLIILVRPVNIVILLLFPLWGVGNSQEFNGRIKFFLSNWIKVMVIGIVVFLVFLPQLLYWKYITGNYLFYGYGDERFFFDNPQFFRGLFSYKKGWLVYTPVMWFAVAGMVILAVRNRGLFFPIMLFTLVNMYIIFSWWCWYGGGSFGMRFLIESYAILALPMATLFRWTTLRKWYLKAAVAIIAIALTCLNLFQTAQFHTGAIHYSAMTKRAYRETFLKLHPTGRFFNMLQFYDLDKAMQGKYIETIAIDQDRDLYIKKTERVIRENPEWMQKVTEKAKNWGLPVDTVIHRDAVWMWDQNHKQDKND